jgi:hypothetical protein
MHRDACAHVTSFAPVCSSKRCLTACMGASHSVSFDASASRDARDGPVLVITADALKQLTSQMEEQKGGGVSQWTG